MLVEVTSKLGSSWPVGTRGGLIGTYGLMMCRVKTLRGCGSVQDQRL